MEIKSYLTVVSDLAEELLPSLRSYQRPGPCCSIVLHHLSSVSVGEKVYM